MTHKQQIQNAIVKELKISQRLFTLLPKDTYDYKPQEGMRTTLELLQSITMWGAWTVEAALTEDNEESDKLYDKYRDYSLTMQPGEFHKRMAEQIAKIESLMSNISDEELLIKNATVVGTKEMPLGQAIIETSLKWVTGYKMQLFLYAKMSGAKELHTGDLWVSKWEETEQ